MAARRESRRRSIEFHGATGWTSTFQLAFLRWYINYACRDDYGALAKTLRLGRHPLLRIARAGRKRTAHLAGRQRLDRAAAYSKAQQLRCDRRRRSIVSCRERTRLRVLTGRREYLADARIFAAPTFLAPYLIEGAAQPRASSIRHG